MKKVLFEINFLNNSLIARNVKLVKAVTEYPEDAKFESLAVLFPTINEETPEFNLSEAKGIKPRNNLNQFFPFSPKIYRKEEEGRKSTKS